ncbi:Roadblock/LC7 domain-containing protein [Hesseltinella vesiculosa]|uniref:Roadblock/LC7 domain-containing protein n=1 Tax=Hesseltinella vesiculosa TaxID=101127 RepID=A0A1X2GI41_9FUNG|nr:Roadblock/LC7 domain-containing protein [Hesseltinella vesiculosa]
MQPSFYSTCQPYFLQGLKAALLTDRDGVVVLKAQSQDCHEKLFDPLLVTNFSISNDQANKLGLLRNQAIVSMFDMYQLIQLDQSPLVLTLIAEADSNTGLWIHLSRQLKGQTDPLVKAMQGGQDTVEDQIIGC